MADDVKVHAFIHHIFHPLPSGSADDGTLPGCRSTFALQHAMEHALQQVLRPCHSCAYTFELPDCPKYMCQVTGDCLGIIAYFGRFRGLFLMTQALVSCRKQRLRESCQNAFALKGKLKMFSRPFKTGLQSQQYVCMLIA